LRETATFCSRLFISVCVRAVYLLREIVVLLVVAFSLQNRLVVFRHDFVVCLANVLHLQDVVLDDELVSGRYLEDVSDDGEENDDRHDLKSIVELDTGSGAATSLGCRRRRVRRRSSTAGAKP
jgi:hypothetical protein